jgi:predicted  nucleic acid-binding Zn-ribbon protein
VSDNERPDVAAFLELEQLIHALAEEMASWRRRAHEAESRLRTMTNGSGSAKSTGRTDLERENDELRRRLDSAQQRTKQLLDRLRFLRQQHELGADR